MTLHLPRRGLIRGALALLAAPAIIRTPRLLMPVSTLKDRLPVGEFVTVTWNEVPLATGYTVYKSASLWLVGWGEQTVHGIFQIDPSECHPA